MEPVHKTHGNDVQFFLVISLFLSSGVAVLLISTTIFYSYNIYHNEQYLAVKQTEEGVDPDYIDQLIRSIENLKLHLKDHIISMAVSIVILTTFIVLEVYYIKSERKPFQQEVSASERIKQALKNQSSKNKEERKYET